MNNLHISPLDLDLMAVNEVDIYTELLKESIEKENQAIENAKNGIK